MKLEHRETSNRANGTAWRDIVRMDGEYVPAYVGEACDQKTADLFCAAPELLEALKEAFDRFTDNDMQPPNHALSVWLDKAEKAISKAENRQKTVKTKTRRML